MQQLALDIGTNSRNGRALPPARSPATSRRRLNDVAPSRVSSQNRLLPARKSVAPRAHCAQIYFLVSAQMATKDRAERRLQIFSAELPVILADQYRGAWYLRDLTAYREIMDGLVSHHGGRIANTAGDSVLAEFPSVVNAVECAVAVQMKLRELILDVAPDKALRFRIGIHLGDVIIRGEDLLGDGVNVAARLEGIAEPGGICVSGAVYDQIDDKVQISFRPLGQPALRTSRSR